MFLHEKLPCLSWVSIFENLGDQTLKCSPLLGTCTHLFNICSHSWKQRVKKTITAMNSDHSIDNYLSAISVSEKLLSVLDKKSHRFPIFDTRVDIPIIFSGDFGSIVALI